MKWFKSIFASALLIAVSLLWIVGVDSMPVMKVLGLPLFICAFALWANWCNVSEWIDAGFNE